MTNRVADSDLWSAVDALIKPSRVKLVRDGGKVDHASVPSLWDQLLEATGTGSEPQSGGSSRWRTPIDLDVLELRQEILESVHDALISLGKTRRPTLPSSLRLLAASVAPDQPLTEFWEYRVRSWVRRVHQALGLDEEPQPRRIRDTRCPACQATHVTITVDREQQRVPALLIEFSGQRVRAITCDHCGAAWWRGDELHELAEAITDTQAG